MKLPKKYDEKGTLNEIIRIKLQASRIKRIKKHHKYVSDTRDLALVCNEIITSLTNVLFVRMDINSDMIKNTTPFASL